VLKGDQPHPEAAKRVLAGGLLGTFFDLETPWGPRHSGRSRGHAEMIVEIVGNSARRSRDDPKGKAAGVRLRRFARCGIFRHSHGIAAPPQRPEVSFEIQATSSSGTLSHARAPA
jgi:hypothetical protein